MVSIIIGVKAIFGSFVLILDQFLVSVKLEDPNFVFTRFIPFNVVIWKRLFLLGFMGEDYSIDSISLIRSSTKIPHAPPLPLVFLC